MINNRDKKRQDAFTLVELSIVLVIIGLIVAGVTAGSSLVRAAEVRSELDLITQAQAAITTFKYTYDALPGDMSNASSYWPTAQDGDGNGNWSCYKPGYTIEGWEMPDNPENFGGWDHLSKAKLFPGTYTGVKGSVITPGSNVPKLPTGKLDSISFYFGNDWSVYPQQNALNIMKADPWSRTVPVKEAYYMDKKTDDGKPFTGKVITFSGNSGYCFPSAQLSATGTTVADRDAVTYTFSYSGASNELCEMQFAVMGTSWK